MMRIPLIALNACFLIGCAACLHTGFAVNNEFSYVPLFMSAGGALLGMIPRRLAVLSECVLMGASFVLFAIGFVISLAMTSIVIMGSSPEKVHHVINDSMTLLILAIACFLCCMLSLLMTLRLARVERLEKVAGFQVVGPPTE
jgi:hypothetical protein